MSRRAFTPASPGCPSRPPELIKAGMVTLWADASPSASPPAGGAPDSAHAPPAACEAVVAVC